MNPITVNSISCTNLDPWVLRSYNNMHAMELNVIEREDTLIREDTQKLMKHAVYKVDGQSKRETSKQEKIAPTTLEPMPWHFHDLSHLPTQNVSMH